MEIPEIKKKLDEGLIPPIAAELPIKEEPEAIPFLISFEKYKDKLCEINNLIKNCPKKALKDLKTIGSKIFDLDDFNKNGIDTEPIKCEGEYTKLFNGLSEDEEVKEHKLQGSARTFYFLNAVKRRVYIIAITNKHLETDKVNH